MKQYAFTIQHKTSYKTRIVRLMAPNELKAKQELYRCYPNYNLINSIK